MNLIEFKQTNNIFVNAGIVALHRYIEKFMSQEQNKYTGVKNNLGKNKLTVECDQLLLLLEDVYYFMGKEIYNTATKKQIEDAKNENANFYYEIKSEKFISFPKMNTYGLTQLFTNNAQGITRHESNTTTIKKLEKSDNKLANKFKNHFECKGIKLRSKLYFNEPYTKITRLLVNENYLKPGNKICPILNDGFKQLVEGKNISPFVSGISNFNSYLQSSEKKISWKALYLIRFSPALVFYTYKNGYDTLICHFFNSNNLPNIDTLCNPALYKSKNELETQHPLPYSSNFNFYDFIYTRNDEEKYRVKSSDDTFFTSEVSFLMLYTFYKRHFEEEIFNNKNASTNIVDPFRNHPLEKIPISIISFKADKFASTLRPNEYEEFNNVKYIFRLIYNLEQGEEKILIKDLWYGLKLRTPSSSNTKDFNKARRLERIIRSEIFSNVLKGKSIVNQIEKLFYDSYNHKINGFNTGYRNYKTILNFLIIYEQTLKNNKMDKELQKKAINLGKSIGQGIINFGDDEDKKTKAKNGRKYIIGLHKSRTLQQFLDNLYRIANKYGISVSNEILENINEENFMLIKQFSLIGALNQLNSVLKNNNN